MGNQYIDGKRLKKGIAGDQDRKRPISRGIFLISGHGCTVGGFGWVCGGSACMGCPLNFPALREINATPELTPSLPAPSPSLLILAKLNICAVLCKGRNINQNVHGAPRRAALPPCQARPPPCHGHHCHTRGHNQHRKGLSPAFNSGSMCKCGCRDKGQPG